MPNLTQLPALSGKQLISVLQKDGWIVKRQGRHGMALAKNFGEHSKVTVVPNTRASLDDGTLGAILGVKQTCIGRRGLLDLINKYGL